MPVFVIAYDLVDAESYDYDALIGQLEKLQSNHIQESVWLVDWLGTDIELLSHLAPFFSIDDSVFIVEEKDWLYHRGKNKVDVTVVGNSPVMVSASWGSRLTPIE